MSELEYPLASHPDRGLSEFEKGPIPDVFIPILRLNNVDPFNAYEGSDGLDEVDFIGKKWLQSVKSGITTDEFYPGDPDDFILVAKLMVLKHLDKLDRNPFLVSDRTHIPYMRFLMYMFLKDMETVDPRIFDLAHESEMVIMNNTILDTYFFERAYSEVLGYFTLKRSNTNFPVSLHFEFSGNPTKKSFEYKVQPQTTNKK